MSGTGSRPAEPATCRYVMSVRSRSSEYKPHAGLHCSPAGSNPSVNPNSSTAVRNSLGSPHPSHPNDVPETPGVDAVVLPGAEGPLGAEVSLGAEVGAEGAVPDGGAVPVQAVIADSASPSVSGRMRCTRRPRTRTPFDRAFGRVLRHRMGPESVCPPFPCTHRPRTGLGPIGPAAPLLRARAPTARSRAVRPGSSVRRCCRSFLVDRERPGDVGRREVILVAALHRL